MISDCAECTGTGANAVCTNCKYLKVPKDGKCVKKEFGYLNFLGVILVAAIITGIIMMIAFRKKKENSTAEES